MPVVLQNSPNVVAEGLMSYDVGAQQYAQQERQRQMAAQLQQQQLDAHMAAQQAQLAMQAQAHQGQLAAEQQRTALAARGQDIAAATAQQRDELAAQQADAHARMQAAQQQALQDRAIQAQQAAVEKQQAGFAHDRQMAMMKQGLKDGSLQYTPEQNTKIISIQKAISDLYQDPRFTDEQRQQAEAQLNQQLDSIRPVEVPLDKRPPSGQDIVNKSRLPGPLSPGGQQLFYVQDRNGRLVADPYSQDQLKFEHQQLLEQQRHAHAVAEKQMMEGWKEKQKNISPTEQYRTNPNYRKTLEVQAGQELINEHQEVDGYHPSQPEISQRISEILARQEWQARQPMEAGGSDGTEGAIYPPYGGPEQGAEEPQYEPDMQGFNAQPNWNPTGPDTEINAQNASPQGNYEHAIIRLGPGEQPPQPVPIPNARPGDFHPQLLSGRHMGGGSFNSADDVISAIRNRQLNSGDQVRTPNGVFTVGPAEIARAMGQ